MNTQMNTKLYTKHYQIVLNQKQIKTIKKRCADELIKNNGQSLKFIMNKMINKRRENKLRDERKTRRNEYKLGIFKLNADEFSTRKTDDKYENMTRSLWDFVYDKCFDNYINTEKIEFIIELTKWTDTPLKYEPIYDLINR